MPDRRWTPHLWIWHGCIIRQDANAPRAGLSWLCKRAQLRGLTVCVPAVPLALHLPIRQDLEVVPAVHTVQLRQPPVVSREIAVRCLEVWYSRAFIRHHAPQPRIQPGILDVSAGQWEGCVPLQWSGVYMLVSEHGEAQDGVECAFSTPALWNDVPEGPKPRNFNITLI